MPRLTMHNGRCHKAKNGGSVTPFNVKHNDRNFDLSLASHIDKDKTGENFNQRRYAEAKTNEENEKIFYEKYFSAHLKEQNEKHIKARHENRVRTMDDYRLNKKTCPEETLFSLGTKEEHYDEKILLQVVKEFTNWKQKKFPQVAVLSVDMHLDEPNCAPHIHMRSVWVARDEKGNRIVSQNKALEQMGVQRPNPNEEKGRFNNPKQTYTKICREKLIEIAKSHGLEIETKPRERSRMGLTKLEYENQKLEDKIKAREEEVLKSYTEIFNDKVKKGVEHEIKPLKKVLERIQLKDGTTIWEMAQNELKRVNRDKDNDKTL